MDPHFTLTRRAFVGGTAVATAGLLGGRALRAATLRPFKLRYAVASSLYGGLSLTEILPEVPLTGANVIDLWPRKHGTQREEADEWGRARLTEALKRHGVSLGLTTRFDLGPFGLAEELKYVAAMGGRMIVTGGKGAVGLAGPELKEEVRRFVEGMKPTLALAGEAGVQVAIENHSNNLINTPDSLRWMLEFSSGQPIGVALAPYHLPQDPELLAGLIREMGPRLLLFYAWGYGRGCMKPMPLEEELMQMPGRGPLDYAPLLRALRDIRFDGLTEIFMHPTPRGRPILETATLVTEELNRARRHLESVLSRLPR